MLRVLKKLKKFIRTNKSLTFALFNSVNNSPRCWEYCILSTRASSSAYRRYKKNGVCDLQIILAIRKRCCWWRRSENSKGFEKTKQRKSTLFRSYCHRVVCWRRNINRSEEIEMKRMGIEHKRREKTTKRHAANTEWELRIKILSSVFMFYIIWIFSLSTLYSSSSWDDGEERHRKKRQEI